MKELSKGIIDFIKKNYLKLIFPILALVLSYGFYATNYTYHIDQLVYAYFNGSRLITAGRWTSTLTNVLTNTLITIPFWNIVFVSILLFFASLFWAVLLKKVSNDKISDVALIVFMTFFVCSPILAEHITYIIIFEAIPQLLTPIAIYYFFEFTDTKKISKLIIALVLFVYLADHEQYAGVLLLSFFIIWTVKWIYAEDRKGYFKNAFFSLVKFAIVLLVAIGIDFGISKIICYAVSGSFDFWYPNNTTIFWIENFKAGLPISETIKNLFASLFAWYVIGGTGYIGLFVLQLFTVIAFIVSIVYAVKNKSFIPVLLFICATISVIALDIVVGKVLTIRTEQTIVVYVAFAAMLIYLVFAKKKAINIIVCILLTFICLWQTQEICQKTIKNYERYQYEENLMVDAADDLVAYPTDDKPVLFIVGENTKVNDYQILPKALSDVTLSDNPIVWRYQKLMFKIWDKVLPSGMFKRFEKATRDSSGLPISCTRDVFRNLQKSPLRRSFIWFCSDSGSYIPQVYFWLEKLGYTYTYPGRDMWSREYENCLPNDYDKRYVITEKDDCIVVQFMMPKY